MQEHLSKARKILDSPDPNTRQLLKSMEKALQELKKQQMAHLKFRVEYAREMVDLVKTESINVGPQQKKLQTLPYLTGRDRQKVAEEPKKKRRKQK